MILPRLFVEQNFKSVIVAIVILIMGCHSKQDWQLHDVTHHLPYLHFSLLSHDEKIVTERDFQGYVVLLFFGFTHCQTECPTTLHRLTSVMHNLGMDAKQVHILFISVDSSRDNPHVLQRYVALFDTQQLHGLTGNMTEIEDMAKRYRIAYRANEFDPAIITHSTAVYVFDPRGDARLVITPADSNEAIAADLRKLLKSSE
jgi:protein SCO1